MSQQSEPSGLEMTPEEAIAELQWIHTGFNLPQMNAIRMAIAALRENDRLKELLKEKESIDDPR